MQGADAIGEPLLAANLFFSTLLDVSILEQLAVPVSAVQRAQERHPLLMMAQAEGLEIKGGPFRTARPLGQMHPGFFGCLPAFAPVAGMAGADHVLPRRTAAARARDDVVEVQVDPREALAAVLAGVAVARVDIKT